jgi:hypothetical protein
MGGHCFRICSGPPGGGRHPPGLGMTMPRPHLAVASPPQLTPARSPVGRPPTSGRGRTTPQSLDRAGRKGCPRREGRSRPRPDAGFRCPPPLRLRATPACAAHQADRPATSRSPRRCGRTPSAPGPPRSARMRGRSSSNCRSVLRNTRPTGRSSTVVPACELDVASAPVMVTSPTTAPAARRSDRDAFSATDTTQFQPIVEGYRGRHICGASSVPCGRSTARRTR